MLIKSKYISFLIRNWTFLVIFICIVILFYTFYRLSTDIEQLSKKSLDKAIETTINELNNYISPFVKNIKLSKEWGMLGQFNLSDEKSLNERFIPILKTYNQITSMLIGRSDGCEYMLLNEDTTWLNRKTITFPNKEVRKIRWKINKNNLYKILDELWNERMNYDPRIRPWYRAALSLKNTDTPAWTQPYIFATTKEPGITTSMPFNVIGDTMQWVIAYDLKIFDIALFSSRLKVSENGKLVILTEDSLTIGLPNIRKFTSSAALKQNILKPIDSLYLPELSLAFNLWHKNHNLDNSFSFKYNNDTWWSKFVYYTLNKNLRLTIGVVVPESDFVSEVKKTRNIIILSFLLVIALIIVIVISYYQKQRINQILKVQKEQIQQQRDLIAYQKKEIEDSIHYAQKIQSAILPEPQLFENILKNYFVIFKPKDVVSGDFYWINEVNQWKIILVADCTGHGIPGGFMSMLGFSFLNEIVIKKEIINPAEILNLLRNNIIEALKQKDISHSQKDGMDVSILAFNSNQSKYLWGGANNALWILKNENIKKINQTEELSTLIEEIKPDNMPVAIYENMKPFTLHTIQLSPNDRVYLFSDGFADQFGGPKGKKYLSKNLKRLIVKTAIYTLEEQKELIERELHEWMNSFGKTYEQTDDITLIGIEI